MFATFKIARVDMNFDSIVKFLDRNWKLNRWGGFPEVTLIYLSYAGYNKHDWLVQEPVEYLLETQLQNGA